MKKVSSLALLFASTAFFSSLAHAQQPIVCVETNLDSFCMELEASAPLATANFLSYVDSGAYNSTFIHQSVRGNFMVGGSWKASSFNPAPVVTAAPVANEFKLPNVAGTVALVTTPGQPNSATSGWRINVSDNSSQFSQANSGAVFAHILANPVNGDGMDVVKRLSKLPVIAANSTSLSQAPLLRSDSEFTYDDLVLVKRIYRYKGTKDQFLANGIHFQDEDMQDVVCLQTTLTDALSNRNELCLKLDPVSAPKTVANFLTYLDAGDYDGTLINRVVQSFVFQGGGFRFTDGKGVAVPTRTPVASEYKRANTYGTIAIALSSDPNTGVTNDNSGTNQWFINTHDNSNTLNSTTNGHFTVFGDIIPASHCLVKTIDLVTPVDLSASLDGNFGSTPLVKRDTPLVAADFITVTKAIRTQRDASVMLDACRDPLANVGTMTEYLPLFLGFGVRLPVRVDNKLYSMMLLTDANDGSKFDVDLVRINQLTDNGRIAANFDRTTLTMTIPSVRVKDKIFVNVTLKLIDAQTLQFQLLSGWEQL